MTVPHGAHRSDDGQYWWDGHEWKPVPPEEQHPGAGSSSDDPALQGPAFYFDTDTEDMGVRLSGPNGAEEYHLPAHQPLKVSFAIVNGGKAPGEATIEFSVDDVHAGEVRVHAGPGERLDYHAVPEIDLSPVDPGRHTFVAKLSPPHPDKGVKAELFREFA
jgi:hypothetical protein